MAFLNFSGANAPIDMSDQSLVQFSATSLGTANFWSWDTPAGGSVTAIGEFIQFDDQDRATSGDIDEVRIELGNGGDAPDMVVSGMRGAAQFLDDSAKSFWDAALDGNTVINVQGLDANKVGANSTSIIFGDDITARTSDSGAVSDSGGNDVFITGDGAYTLIGDVHVLAGSAASGEIATYVAGNDLITGASTDAEQLFVGDALEVGGLGLLFGGNDTLSSASANDGSAVVGDAFLARGEASDELARVGGGDDKITGLNPVQADDSRAILIGDVAEISDFVSAFGGKDTIAGSNESERIAGDFGSDFSDQGSSLTGGDDRMDGGGGNDTMAGDLLDAGGEASLKGGKDIMRGGDGDDRMFGEVASADDEALAGVKGGADRMFGQIGDDDMFGQTGNDLMKGGQGDDLMFGGQGADTMIGGGGDDRLEGGTGSDILTGGAGEDSFVFRDALGKRNVDTITDFKVADDDIGLDIGIFTALDQFGALRPGAFREGSAAADANDRIVYNSDTGALFYDSDGNGKAKAIQFATLDAGLNLTSADFFGLSV